MRFDTTSRSAKRSSSRNLFNCSAKSVRLKPSSTTTMPLASRMIPSRRALSFRSSTIKPGVSSTATLVYVVFLGLMTAAILASRSSGTSAIAVCPCCTFDGSGFSPVSHSNTVLFPVPAYPTRPIFITTPVWLRPDAQTHLEIGYGRTEETGVRRKMTGDRRQGKKKEDSELVFFPCLLCPVAGQSFGEWSKPAGAAHPLRRAEAAPGT